MDNILRQKNFLYHGVDKEAEEFLHDILDAGINFSKGHSLEGKCLNYNSLSDLKKIANEKLPKNGCEYKDLLEYIENVILKNSISQSSPNYLAFPDTGNSIAGFAADIITAFSNQNLIAVDRSAPIATFVEIQLISWLRELIGYKSRPVSDINCLNEVGGMWTSGGNMSNYTAVLTALTNCFPDIRKKGLQNLDVTPTIIATKDIQHFSFAGAASSLGIGEDNILWCETNPDYTSSMEDIEKKILGCPENKKIFMLVCVAGNCRTTNIDDIKKARELCDKYNLWLHVDACHGGTLLFSNNKDKLDGLSLADSISLDPHKGLFVTYPSSYVMFKNPDMLSCFSRYPGHEKNANIMDLGLIMPFFGSRGFHSLKLWLLIKKIGYAGLCQLVDMRNKLNKDMSSLIDKTGYFCMLNENDFYRQAMVFYPKSCRSIVCQLPKPKAVETINKHSELFSNKLYERGRVCLDAFSLIDYSNSVGFGNLKYSTIGLAIGHPDLSSKDKMHILDEIKTVASDVESIMLESLRSSSIHQEVLQKNKNTSPASW